MEGRDRRTHHGRGRSFYCLSDPQSPPVSCLPGWKKRKYDKPASFIIGICLDCGMALYVPPLHGIKSTMRTYARTGKTGLDTGLTRTEGLTGHAFTTHLSIIFQSSPIILSTDPMETDGFREERSLRERARSASNFPQKGHILSMTPLKSSTTKKTITFQNAQENNRAIHFLQLERSSFRFKTLKY